MPLASRYICAWLLQVCKKLFHAKPHASAQERGIWECIYQMHANSCKLPMKTAEHLHTNGFYCWNYFIAQPKPPTVVSWKHAAWFQEQKLAKNSTTDTLFLVIKLLLLFHLFYPINREWKQNMQRENRRMLWFILCFGIFSCSQWNYRPEICTQDMLKIKSLI